MPAAHYMIFEINCTRAVIIFILVLCNTAWIKIWITTCAEFIEYNSFWLETNLGFRWDQFSYEHCEKGKDEESFFDSSSFAFFQKIILILMKHYVLVIFKCFMTCLHIRLELKTSWYLWADDASTSWYFGWIFGDLISYFTQVKAPVCCFRCPEIMI